MKKIIILLSVFYFGLNVSAQPGTLLSAKKVGSDGNFMFSDSLTNRTSYGRGLCSIGDLNKDGYSDIAVSAYDFDNNEGVIYILFLDDKQEVISYVEIGRNKGGLVPNSALTFDYFGFSMDALGDFNHDGTVDLLVGNQNEVYLLFMNTNGTVKGHKRIATNINGLTLAIDLKDFFGAAVANIGDINGDGITDIAVFNREDRSFGSPALSFLYILFLKQDGSVMRYHRIDTRSNILKDTISSISTGGSRFGTSICSYSQNRIIVGASTDYVEGKFTGVIYILDLDTIGEVTKFKRISGQSPGFTDSLEQGSYFGGAVDIIGDLDGDSIGEIAVGAYNYKDSITTGAVFILSFDKNDNLKQLNRISNRVGGLPYALQETAIFGADIAGVGDLNGDGKFDLITSATRERILLPNGLIKGRIHVLYLDGISHNNNPSNISNTNTLNSLTIYPNPTNDLFQISVADGDELEGDLMIMDMTGKAVYTIKNHNSKIAVDIKNIFSGMYIINYQTNKGIYQGKLIKE